MPSAVELLRSRFKGLYFIALGGLGFAFLTGHAILATLDSSSTIPIWLRISLTITQKLGTDFIAILIFSGILLWAIRRDPKAEVRYASSSEATKLINEAVQNTNEFYYLGSKGMYNLKFRLPILVAKSNADGANIRVSFLLPHPGMGAPAKAVARIVGDDDPGQLAVNKLVVALRLLMYKRQAPNLIISVVFVSHASIVRYDVTDDLIAMSSPLRGNPFILIPRETTMFDAMRDDLKRLIDTCTARVSTTDEEVRSCLRDDRSLATHLLTVATGTVDPVMLEELLKRVVQPLQSRYQ
jgi:hypothetical protein